MADFIFSMNDIKEYIETEIKGSEKNDLLKLLDETDTTETNINATIENYFADHADIGSEINMYVDGGVSAYRIDRKMDSAITEVKKRIYRFLCTEEHKSKREAIEKLFKNVFPLLAETLGLPIRIIIKIATTLLKPILDEKKNNFCENNKCLLDN